MELRPYQKEAKEAVLNEWKQGNKNTLLVLPTGTGKTICFAEVTKERVKQGGKVLILAHREELLDQAADKLKRTTGLECAREKSTQTALGSDLPVTVGSVQTLYRKQRLEKFPKNFYSTIIVDEAHHCLAKTYMNILDHFSDANVLGVTATPDRGDKQSLGKIFDSQAYEYSLKQAIEEKYLCPIRAKLIPISVDLNGVSVQAGDFKVSDLDDAIEPYLDQIAKVIAENYSDRKTVIFLPLIKTSVLMKDLLIRHGLRAAEVNGTSCDRDEILKDFEEGKYDVLCNSMLLTEGWDCPSVDCVVVLRPTKIRSLYSQMVGRGTRLYPGKDDLLLLDFLWMSERHNLCHPSALLASSEAEAALMDMNVAANPGGVDILSALSFAKGKLTEERERALAGRLRNTRGRKAKEVDPIQYYASIQSLDLMNYEPLFSWEKVRPSEKQLQAIHNFGIDETLIRYRGEAKIALDQLIKRSAAGLASPKQIRLLERFGFVHVGSWKFADANSMISTISANGWQVPGGIIPALYDPVLKINRDE